MVSFSSLQSFFSFLRWVASMRRLSSSLVILCYLIVSWFFFCVGISYAEDTLRVGESMTDYGSVESSNKLFQLRFFSLGTSSQRYLGIQYMTNRDADINGQWTAVWVANRNNPLKDSSGVLSITQDGNLVITTHNGKSIILNSGHPAMSANTSLTLLDSGNLVFRDGETTVWQSFDYPSDTWLPGMKLGLFDLNTIKPRRQFLTSWVSTQVPTLGAFTLGIDPNNTNQLIVWYRGDPYWSSGMWNGHNFSYFPNWRSGHRSYNYEFNFSYFTNERESYFTYSTRVDNNSSSWIAIDSSGNIDIFTSSSQDGWILEPGQPCDTDQVEERREGCIKGESSKCRGGDVFNWTNGIMSSRWDHSDNHSLGLGDCMLLCMRDCSCNAYATALSSDMSGCKFSYGKVEYLGGEDFFFLRNSALVEKGQHRSRKKQLWLTIGVPFASLIVLAAVFLFCYLQCRNCSFGGMSGSYKYGMSKNTRQLVDEERFKTGAINELSNAQKRGLIGKKKDHELPHFSFRSIQFATDHFSDANKIGQGGFGPVYKGKLFGGLEVAVKRLSRSTGQGLEEFTNEVILISKLQHRNLVRILGCCTHGDERILVYEYLQNKSLDSFLFDATKRALLDWKLRVSIIEGIAQGLLYLHKYSRLRIIHRDLKTSNILLDNNMNPKISDFGTARIFGENESRANTSRIVGTYGYMSPEYAMDGLFSEKSDVFSFGVMMLEIISGKRNSGFYQSDRYLNLLGYAWDLWKEGRGIELMDQVLAETCPTCEVMLRYLKVGLLCVQESAADRPMMSNVLYMLSNETMALPPPKKPAFSAIVCTVNYSDLPQTSEPCSSINDVTISEVQAR